MKLNRWNQFPVGVRQHLSERLLSRNITVDDLNKLRVWVDSAPDVPEGAWFKDFGSFKLCGVGAEPRTFLEPGQQAWGTEIAPQADATAAD